MDTFKKLVITYIVNGEEKEIVFNWREFNSYKVTEDGLLIVEYYGKIVGCFSLRNIIGFYLDSEL